MINARKQALEVITQALAFMESCVRNSNELRLYDLNVVSEHFFAIFLSAAYQKSFANLNLKGQQPAIDVGDRAAGVCFQISSDGKKTKIRETVARYARHNLAGTYPHLRILIIGRRHGKYSGIFAPSGCQFDVNHDVIGCGELAKHTNTLATQDVLKLESVIRQEMPIFHQATTAKLQSDQSALNEYRGYFDRPALLDPWFVEANYDGFGKALTDLIELMNTGWVRGHPITKKRSQFDDAKWRGQLDKITSQLIALRQLFTIHVRSGEIDLLHNRCAFHDPKVPTAIDGYKQAILGEMNSLLASASLPRI